jgi:hypothetical protein
MDDLSKIKAFAEDMKKKYEETRDNIEPDQPSHRYCQGRVDAYRGLSALCSNMVAEKLDKLLDNL